MSKALTTHKLAARRTQLLVGRRRGISQEAQKQAIQDHNDFLDRPRLQRPPQTPAPVERPSPFNRKYSLADMAAHRNVTWRRLHALPYDPLDHPIEPTAGPQHLWTQWHRHQHFLRNLDHLRDDGALNEITTAGFRAMVAERKAQRQFNKWMEKEYALDGVALQWRRQCCLAVGGRTLETQCKGWLTAGALLAKLCKNQLPSLLDRSSLKGKITGALGHGSDVAGTVVTVLWQHHRREPLSPPEKAADLLTTVASFAIRTAEQICRTTEDQLHAVLTRAATGTLGRNWEVAREAEAALAFFKLRHSTMPLHEAVALLERLVDERAASVANLEVMAEKAVRRQSLRARRLRAQSSQTQTTDSTSKEQPASP